MFQPIKIKGASSTYDKALGIVKINELERTTYNKDILNLGHILCVAFEISEFKALYC